MITCPGEYETVWGTPCWRASIENLIGHDEREARFICCRCIDANGHCEEELSADECYGSCYYGVFPQERE